MEEDLDLDNLTIYGISNLINKTQINPEIDTKIIEDTIVNKTKEDIFDNKNIYESENSNDMMEVQNILDELENITPIRKPLSPILEIPKPLGVGMTDLDDNASVTSSVKSVTSIKLDKVLGDHKKYNDIEGEYRETKMNLISEIDELCELLELQGVDNIRDKVSINEDTSIITLHRTLNQLKRRHDHLRYVSLGNQFIQMIGKAAEHIFDGNRSIGKWSPDLTGLSDALRIRSRYMQSDISLCAKDTIAPYFTNGAPRIMFEIILSMVFHAFSNSHKKSKTRVKPTDLLDF